jgi:hypothetical protein
MLGRTKKTEYVFGALTEENEEQKRLKLYLLHACK